MVKTNILVEVSDKVYDLVVLPHKKQKTFSKLIASLLLGYIEDDYIRSYAEGTLEDMHRASVDALDEVLGGMQQSLASLGLFTDELKSATEMGVETFSGYSEKGKQEVEVTPQIETKSADAEVEELRSTVDELKSQNKEIMDMLFKLMNGSVIQPVINVVENNQAVNTEVATSSEPERVIVKEQVGDITRASDTTEERFVNNQVSNVVDEEVINSVEEVSTNEDPEELQYDDFEEDTEVSDVEEEEESVDASNALASLLQGNMYSF